MKSLTSLKFQVRIAGLLIIILLIPFSPCKPQGKINPDFSGNLLTDHRLKLKDECPWIWNENRLNLQLQAGLPGQSKFHSELWVRNFGFPVTGSLNSLENKTDTDPVELEIREAYLQIDGLLKDKLDITLGRQRIIWGTADQINPTTNLSPRDLEDILDFGRVRGVDALNFRLHFSERASLQAVFVPIFRPANLPRGAFSGIFFSPSELQSNFLDTLGITIIDELSTILIPSSRFTNSNFGLRFKGRSEKTDYSFSYANVFDGFPFQNLDKFKIVDYWYGEPIFVKESYFSYARFHVLGADLATSIGGAGVWAEAALFIPDKNYYYETFNFQSNYFVKVPVFEKSKPFLKYVVGGDYHFRDGSYLNMQFVHGFFHERHKDQMNDYLILKYDKPLFNEKLLVSPLKTAVAVSRWKTISRESAFIYMPEFLWKATPNAELSLSTAIIDGKGSSLFMNLKDFDMMIMRFRYYF